MDSKLEGLTRRSFLLAGLAGCAELTLPSNRLQILVESELERKLQDDEKAGVIISRHGKEYVAINPEQALQCASLVKIPVANAYLYEVYKGRQKMDGNATWWLREMIRISSNLYTNKLIQRLGGPEKVTEILTTNYPEIYKELEIVEEIPKGGRTYKNKASAADYDRALTAIWKHEMPGSRILLNHMAHAHGKSRVRGPGIPKSAGFYFKSGTTAHLYGGVAIVSAKLRTGGRMIYNFVCIIEKENRPKSERKFYRRSRNIMRHLGSLTYQHFKKEIGLE